MSEQPIDRQPYKARASTMKDLTVENSEPFPRSDWQHEVANGDTNLGYADWAFAKSEAEESIDVPKLYHEGFPVQAPRLPFPKIPTGEMTRGNQTLLIIAAIAVVALGALWFATRLPDGHYLKKCQGLVLMDKSCEALVHANLMMRGY